MNDSLTPENMLAENELICEKLLGWKRTDRLVDALRRTIWLIPSNKERMTPSFTDWAEAGLILEVLDARMLGVEVGNFGAVDEHWYCDIESLGPPVAKASTAPLAVRAAAIAYIRSRP